jgi:hypothetical protein
VLQAAAERRLRHNGRGAGRVGSAEPVVLWLWRVQAYLPEKDLAISAEVTVEKKAKGGVNGGMEVFEEVATELEPNHPPQP